ncbi:CHAT domain-containing protein [Sphaerisporangium krabiense]|uniref:Tetratricopeptide (TPR) repeat protein n=1 Tax=Sphaerisporangium krabiense TaxID=763782 RepID=A0A7W8ZCC9_9ACTN|nr:CHAT domain-containing protein [Sphaerisporangium krabiense]MBB5631414.1 tetratricopeptide (TPR) repeat protein [Sphaerisporangium krabiense]GII60832.1 CHAT domain-containing protein [Sphaerisporangium krabiense]
MGNDPESRLRERLRRFSGGDHEALSGQDALADIAAARQALSRGDPADESLAVLAYAHLARYQVLPFGEDAADLEQAVALFTRLRSTAPHLVGEEVMPMLESDPRVVVRDDPHALIEEAERTGDLAVVDAALDLLARTLPLQDPGDLQAQATVIGRAALVRRRRHQLTGDPADLDGAIAGLRRTLDFPVVVGEGRTAVLYFLAELLARRFELDGDLAGLEAAIEAQREVRGAWSDDAGTALALAAMLRIRSERTGDGAGLQEALALGRQVLAEGDLSGQDGQGRPAALMELAQSLQAWSRHTGDPAHLEEAIAVLRAAGEPARVALGQALTDRYRHGGPARDLDEAVTVLGAAAPDHTTVLDAGEGREAGAVPSPEDLAGVLLRRFERDGDPADLERAVALLQDALREARPGSPGHLVVLVNLSAALHARAELAGTPEGFTAVVDLLSQARADHLAGGPHLADLHGNLGNALHARHDLTGDPADLDAAVAAHTAAVEAMDPADPARASRLSNLGLIVQSRFERAQDDADLEASLVLHAEAVAAVPPGDRDRPRYLSNQGLALRTRYERFGDPRDLDAAIAVLREAASSEQAGRESWRWPANLGNALRLRYHLQGASADIDEAIVMLRRAVEAMPADRAGEGAQVSLGEALAVRYGVGGAPGDIAEALPLLGAAAQVPGPGQAARLNAHGMALVHRYEHGRDEGDLAAAFEVLTRAVAATPEGDPRLAVHLSNLAVAARMRAAAGAPEQDPDAAVARLRAALASVPAGHGLRAAFLLNLASVTEARYRDHGDERDYQDALAAAREAALAEAGTMAHRLPAARLWADLAADHGDHAEALRAYRLAIDLVPTVAWHGLSWSDQEIQTRRSLTGLGVDACACAIEAGEVETAVELVERGRAVMWSSLLHRRGDLDALAEAAPGLAGALREVRARLDAAAERAGAPARAVEDARGWDRLLAEARRLPGFEDFLRPVRFARLREAAREGAVVVVNLSERRCDALVVTSGGVAAVPLPGLTSREAAFRAAMYLDVLGSMAVPMAMEPGERRSGLLRGSEGFLGDVLAWLWTAVAEPVLAHLGHTRAPAGGGPWPRVWWCPTGALTLLPLHAAGTGQDGDSVLDRVVSSYTPTLGALDRARQGEPRPGAPALVVTVPAAPGVRTLTGPYQEAAFLRRVLDVPPVRLHGAQATRAAVAAALPGCGALHFSGHGTQELTAPSRGGLVLYDGVLAVRDLTGLDVRGELAFLSACQTATGGAELPDEGVHLASALQIAGFRHVIATLWSVYDLPSVEVTRAVYGALAKGVGPAVALHEAVRALRAAHPAAPSVWASYVHTGP